MPVSQAELQAEIEQLVAKHPVPGAVVAVWQDGELATAAAGVANLNTGAPMTADTAYLTGSITKVWHTTLIMTFVEEGLIDLDTPITRYAPDIQFGADIEVAKALTYRHLVNHSNGIDSSDLFVEARPYPEGAEDYLGALAKAGKLTEPGTVSSYNNAGWIISDLILRRLTGKNFHELLRERVIEPLGLRRTVFSPAEAILHRTAIGSFPGPDGGPQVTPSFMYPDQWAGAGTTLITTVEDTLQFLLMHLAGGVSAEGRRLIAAESAQAMQTPTSPDPTGPQSGFGLGWMYHEGDGHRVFSHGGGSIGGTAQAMISPGDNLAVVAFVNSSVGTPLHADIFKLVLPDGPSPLPAPVGDFRDDVPLEPFLGTYSRKTVRLDISPSAEHAGQLLVRLIPVPEEFIGAEASRTAMVTEFNAVPTSESTLVSCGELPGGTESISFYENSADSYQLLYTGRRLSRRVA